MEDVCIIGMDFKPPCKLETYFAEHGRNDNEIKATIMHDYLLVKTHLLHKGMYLIVVWMHPHLSFSQK